MSTQNWSHGIQQYEATVNVDLWVKWWPITLSLWILREERSNAGSRERSNNKIWQSGKQRYRSSGKGIWSQGFCLIFQIGKKKKVSWWGFSGRKKMEGDRKEIELCDCAKVVGNSCTNHSMTPHGYPMCH